MKSESRYDDVNSFDEDNEATEDEVKGVAYTGLSILALLLILIASLGFLFW